MVRRSWHPWLFVIVGLMTIAAGLHGWVGTTLAGLAIAIWLLRR